MGGDELFRAALTDQGDDEEDGGYWPLLIVFSDGALNANGGRGTLLLAWAAFATIVTLAVLGTALGAAALWLAGVAYEHLDIAKALVAALLIGVVIGWMARRIARRGQAT